VSFSSLKSAPLPKFEVESAFSNDEIFQRAERCLKFIDSSPEPFHCVKTVADALLKNGFIQIEESSNWSNLIQKGKKYFYTRNGSSIVAFIVGGKFEAGNGFKIVGAHTDIMKFLL